LAALVGCRAGSPDGTITGRLEVPGFDEPPALRVYAQSLAGPEFHTTNTAAGQTAYRLDVPSGEYVVYAWLIPEDGLPDQGGAYTNAVICKLEGNPEEICSDHSIIFVLVLAGKVTEGIDIVDWEWASDAEPGMIPPPIIPPPPDGLPVDYEFGQ
jgi:hypothetical protein